jgi:hypothetical protein
LAEPMILSVIPAATLILSASEKIRPDAVALLA